MRNLLWIGSISRQRLACVILVSASLSRAYGDLTTNLTPVADTTLRDGLSADTSFGAISTLPVGVGTFGSPINHGLFKFPVELLPANATVTQVTLHLTTIVTNTTTPTYDLFRVLKDWNETDTTWNTRLAPAVGWGVPGAQPGVDYESAASASAPIAPAPSVNPFSSASLLADVNLWRADSGTNFGWILIATGESAGSGKQIASREDPARAPVLIVTYTVPASPAAPVLFNSGLVGGAFRFSFNAASNYAHVVEAGSSLSPTNWTMLTNLPAFPADTVLHITNNVDGSQRYFRVGVQ